MKVLQYLKEMREDLSQNAAVKKDESAEYKRGWCMAMAAVQVYLTIDILTMENRYKGIE